MQLKNRKKKKTIYDDRRKDNVNNTFICGTRLMMGRRSKEELGFQ